MPGSRGFLLLVRWVFVAGVAVVPWGCDPSSVASASNATANLAPAHPVGRQVCGSCHAKELALWQGSHHDKAMEEPTDATVLGDFRDATFTHQGVVTTLSRRSETFVVRTEGADGAPHDFPVAYTFGVEPLQQYLTAAPGGRFQALSVAWDSRPAAAGGQRWLSLDPSGERIAPGDPLHWTGARLNWNSMCAECHSTDLEKRYRPESDSFETRWGEIDVSCEACHGPGSRHVAWASGDRKPIEGKGFVVALARGGTFDPTFDPATGTARGGAIDPATSRSVTQIDACGRCHSRRTPIAERYEYGRPLLATHDLALLDENLYHPDGQIRDEVFEVGSFLESKMYRHGVVCSDCHEPHAATLRAAGDALCTRCHDAGRFAQSGHHHHAPDSAAARCVNCHMPSKTYMRVDERRDHSLRIPRPDLATKLGVPNPCASCHAAKSADWAARAVASWTGLNPSAHWAEAIVAGRRSLPDAPFQLARMIDDGEVPGIARATALGLLARQGGVALSEIAARVAAAEGEADPLLRRAAATAGEALDEEERWRLVSPLLSDDLLGVRIEAARVLAPLALGRARSGLLTVEERRAFDAAAEDFRSAQRANAERPESPLNLGWLAAQLGDLGEAESSFRRSIQLDPDFLPARINLAEILRRTGRAPGEKRPTPPLANTPQAGKGETP